MDKLLLLGMNGLIWGLIIALIALGLAIIFGLLDIINLAHGDFFMVGTVLAWATLQSTGSFWLAFLIAPLIGFALGALIQRVVIAPIHNVAALSIVATFGLSLILQESVRITYDWLFEADRLPLSEADLQHYVALWDITNRKDARNCEWQQQGLRSRAFKHGVYVPQEFDCHRFAQWVRAGLAEDEPAGDGKR